MRRVLLLVTVAAMMAAMMAASALPAFADRVVTGDDVNVHPHQHFITPNGEQVAVGPEACGATESPNQEGFDQFHVNVHSPTLVPGGAPVTNPATPNQFAFQQENNPVGFTAVGC